MDQLKNEKEEFKKNIVPQWIKDAQERQSKIEIVLTGQ
jgi:formate-dependent nitrite reductase cytochrome c552 subunit